LLVISNRLGCLNHTLLTIECIRARGLSCRGLVLNTLPGLQTEATKSNRQALEEICDVPILFDIHPDQKEIELAVA
jgi:dethiobiotin synthetase